MKFYGIGRVAKIQDLKVTKNDDGTEVKSITFTVASKRNYSVNKTVNGQIVSERPTDFLFCKSYGKLAETINEYCNMKDENGKLISRHIQINGELRTYRKDEKRYTTINLNGEEKDLCFTVPIEHTMLLVTELEFLDSTSNNKPKVTTKTPEGKEVIDVGTVSTSPKAEGTAEKATITTQESNAIKEDPVVSEGNVDDIPSDEELDQVLNNNEPF